MLLQNVLRARGRRRAAWAMVVVALAACTGGEFTPPEVDGAASKDLANPRIKVLSSRPDLVTGGTALIELELPPGIGVASVRVEADGRDVSNAFAMRANGRFLGLVKGLGVGRNRLRAVVPGGAGAIDVVNHPTGGPLFSGAQLPTWKCLPDAVDQQCGRPTRYEYFYDADYKVYDPQNPPATVTTITTDQGKTVPYIVRVETVSQNRGQLMIGVLYDPSKPWEPWAPQDGWNGKLYNIGGANCGMAYAETAAHDVKTQKAAIARGFMVWSTSLSNNQNHCSPLMHGESLVMGREHIAKTYGPARYSIGHGQSGGSIKAQQVANEWPGVFDGLSVSLSFPDIWSTLQETYDCTLMVQYWARLPTSGVVWTETQWAAAAGHQSMSVCLVWNQAFGGILVPRSVGQVCTLPDGVTAYHPVNNPTGVRCSLQDYQQAQFGLRPPERWGPIEKQIGRGFANRPLDNVGVQYGLRALQAGQITIPQFLDLNEKIGGYDIDLNLVSQRTEADPEALAAVNRGMLNAATHLTLPIIDARAHDGIELHHDYFTYAVRARLDRAHGHHDNHVVWTGPIPLYAAWMGPCCAPLYETEALNAMDQWLAAIEQDTRAVPLAQKVVDDKPAVAHDKCTDALGFELPKDSCRTLYPTDTSPRFVAGQPFTGDVIKCQLKPLRQSDYFPLVFDNAQWAKLKAIFPTGVCDYTKPGVEQQPTIPWVTYADGPGGQPLPAAPVPEGWAGPVFRAR